MFRCLYSWTLHLTLFSPREDWDDLVARFPLLGYRRQRFGAVVGWERVFARASAKDGTAHPYWRGWGFILRISVITHCSRSLWASQGADREGEHGGVRMERVTNRQGSKTTLTSAGGTGVLMHYRRMCRKWWQKRKYLEENETTVWP